MEKKILDLFINNITQFVFWKDRNSTYLGCNNNFASSAGFDSPDEVIGKTDYDMPWSKEEADFFREKDNEVMSSKKPQLNFEEPQTLQNGETRWLSTSKIPIYDNNKVIGLLGWYIDITEYKQMEIELDEKNKSLLQHSLQLEKSKSELKIANDDLEKFTYAVSHDLKAPIRNMLNFAQLIERENTTDRISEYVNFIISSGQRMTKLVDDILSYARTGHTELFIEKTPISNLISEKLLDLQELISSKSANIEVKLNASPINCYPKLLGLVFYNLINNGLKFNESEVPTIICSSSQTESHWIFSVHDNGIGIDPTYANKIFEPFKRLQGRNYEGSGIGLAICQRVVNIHKGEIWLENNTEGGTHFKFSVSKNL